MTVDDYAQNDTLTMDFDVVPGTWLSMEIQFDFLPHGISWAVEHNDLGLVVLEGSDYFNDEYASEFIEIEGCASDGCYTLTVEDLFGNGMHYSPPGWYSLSDSDGNILGEGSGNFGAEQTHGFCVEGSSVEPCVDVDGNGVCDEAEGELQVTVLGCTDPLSCTFDAEANTDDEAVTTSMHSAIVGVIVRQTMTGTGSAIPRKFPAAPTRQRAIMTLEPRKRMAIATMRPLGTTATAIHW